MTITLLVVCLPLEGFELFAANCDKRRLLAVVAMLAATLRKEPASSSSKHEDPVMLDISLRRIIHCLEALRFRLHGIHGIVASNSRIHALSSLTGI